MKKYQHVCLGGTFDRLHIGHKNLLDLAFKIGNHLTIGLSRKVCSKDKLLVKVVEDYASRRQGIENYLKVNKFLRRSSIIPLDNIYGSAASDKTLEAIIVSQKTYPNALKINKLRKQKKLPLLKIIVTPFVLGDDGKVITSGRIRAGEIDREGHNFQFSIFNFQKKQLFLPEYLRTELRKPLGRVILGEEHEWQKTAKKALQYINIMKSTMMIAVGDVITNSLLKIGFDPDIKIVDFRVRRKNIQDYHGSVTDFHGLKYPRKSAINLRESLPKIKNRPGTISTQAINAIRLNLKNYLKTGNKQVIIIDGEEDLTALPAILLAPLRSVVLYGQMDLGVVAVSVTEEKKEQVREILRKFVQL